MRALAWLLILLLAPLATAQTYQHLGDDPTGDAQYNGVPMLDTWIDINGLAVDTVGEDLVFWLGLQGDTTEAGSYCWMAAFEFGGTEYVGLDCYEAVAYTNDNTLSGVSAPSTSRGTNVASSVTFEDGAAKIVIPLSAIGAGYGDEITDIYGLTYMTRVLTVVDTVPDQKRSADAAESLGSYIIGGAPTIEATPVVNETANVTLNETLEPIVQETDGTIHITTMEASNETHVYTFNRTGNVTGALSFNGTGAFDLRIDDNGTTIHNGTWSGVGNETLAFQQLTGNVTLTFVLQAFNGTIDLAFQDSMPSEATDEPVVEDTPMPLMTVAVPVLGAAYLRNRRTNKRS